MPVTFRGVGTAFYGAREFRPDGSHITTKWFLFAYVPVIPLSSLRIRCTGDNKNRLVYGACRITFVEKTKLSLPQVFAVYGWFALVIASFVAAYEYRSW